MVKKGFCQMSLLIVLSAVLFISGCGADSETTSTPDTSAPTAPTGVTAVAASFDTISVTWIAATDNVGVTGYGVYRDNTLIASLTTPTTVYRDANCSASQTYTYVVAAGDAAGNVSGFSAGATTTSLAIGLGDLDTPSAPGSLAAVKSAANQVTLSWNASTDGIGIAGYNIYRATSASATPVQVGTTTATSYIDAGLTAGTTYYYVVRAFDGVPHESLNSNQAMATP